jgi:nicotinate phosphoribosyltransferase
VSTSNLEQLYVSLLTGNPGLLDSGWNHKRTSVLLTDAYKFSMAQAGFPLRQETFYLCCRRGGPHHIPFDLRRVVHNVLPGTPTAKEHALLSGHVYGLTPAMGEALQGDFDLWVAPKGSWVHDREPILTITGPSFLVSWLEPLLIMLNFPIQVSTAIQNGQTHFVATCSDEARIIQTVFDSLGVVGTIDIQKDYRERVGRNVDAILKALGGPEHCARIFEVGLRSASCLGQHIIVMEECLNRGVTRTSNMFLRHLMGAIPVGTTGHEHQQRWLSDLDAFRALRDMRPGSPSYLFDTYDPLRGLDVAFQVAREHERAFSLRFDSGDQDAQFEEVLRLCQTSPENQPGYLPTLIFEDGYTAERTASNERKCQAWPEALRKYGYGGFLVTDPAEHGMTRDRVGCVYKLSQTGTKPVMKLSGTPGKESLPGRPFVAQHRDNPEEHIIGQYEPGVGSVLPKEYVALEPGPRPSRPTTDLDAVTQALIAHFHLTHHKENG